MIPLSADIKKTQLIKDVFFTRNCYNLNDKYVLRDGKKHPFALICPGGAYQCVCNFSEGIPYAEKLNRLGISCFILHYRVKKKASFPNPQDDLSRAVKEILKKADFYQIEASTYSVWGSSAGGHLAASFGTETLGYRHYNLPKPAAIVLAYPVISMLPELTHRLSHDNLLGKNKDYQKERETSIELHITNDYPPTYIWCGDADTDVSPENTRLMSEALKKEQVVCQCEIFKDVVHGVGPGTGTSAEGWIEHAAKFWLRNCGHTNGTIDIS